MTIKIIRDKQYSEPVHAIDVHGKYPYKLYLEIIGNTNIGRYIVVISDKQLNIEESVNSIIVQLTEKVLNTRSAKHLRQGNRPNMVGNEYFLKYRVKESDILKVGNNELLVFKPIKD